MRSRSARTAVAVLALGALALGVLAAGPASAGVDEPPLTVSEEELDAALTCPDAFEGDGEPVLLVHGTGTTAHENFSWNFSIVLPAEGLDVCTVQMPGRTLGDIQATSEYVVHAIRTIAAASGERVDVVGHSQGGLQPRWALRWWPSLRAVVDDLVPVATPNHGTIVASGICGAGRCHPSVWQMRVGSAFLGALNDGHEVPAGVDVTSIYSSTDEFVQPALPGSTAVLAGATNVKVQDVCPGRPVEHVQILGDAVGVALVIDALVHPGAADPARLPAEICTRTAARGVDPVALLTADAGATFLDDVLGGTFLEGGQTSSEPELAPYTGPPSDTDPGSVGGSEGRGEAAANPMPATGGGVGWLGVLTAALGASALSRRRPEGRARWGWGTAADPRGR